MAEHCEHPEELTVRAERLVAGGAALAKEESGRVVLVEGALPGELVLARVTQRRRDVVFAEMDHVLEGVPARVNPPCPHVADGCGGCDLQYVMPSWQPTLKTDIVADALHRLGGVPDPPVRQGPPLPAGGGRTTVRAGVSADGRAGFRKRRSHDLVELDSCLVAHPLVGELLVTSRFPPGVEVTIRCGAASGDRLVLVHGSDLTDVAVPDDVVVVSGDQANSARAHIAEEVAGRWWRVSARSFFQSRPEGAAALADAVWQALAPADEPVSHSGRLVDLYAGVGLFAGICRDRGWSGPITAVERSDSSVRDARANLSSAEVEVLQLPVQRWRPKPAEAVIADPSREGLGREGVVRVAGTHAAVVILVSCDAAALGRDTALLRASGYELADAVVVDLFPHTHHVEVVSRFIRAH